MVESFFANKATPPAAALLGWQLVREDPEAGTIEIAFCPDERMLNSAGTVQGGFVAAMLDDTMGPALVSMSGGRVMPSSINLTVSFLRPVKPGRVVKLGKAIAFLEAELFDDDGVLLARGTSSAVPIAIS